MSALHYRKSIRDYFATMADPSQQWQIGPTEAVCEWFDDMYIPHHAAEHPQSRSWHKAVQEFESCFKPAELDAMRDYHTYFSEIVDRFDVNRPWTAVQSDPDWIRLTAEARKALDVFDTQT